MGYAGDIKLKLNVRLTGINIGNFGSLFVTNLSDLNFNYNLILITIFKI